MTTQSPRRPAGFSSPSAAPRRALVSPQRASAKTTRDRRYTVKPTTGGAPRTTLTPGERAELAKANSELKKLLAYLTREASRG